MPGATEQRKLAAIMFTDMVGYSALSQRDEKLAQELLEEHREILREIFPRFNGTEIKTIGDAFLVEFNSALEAAQCAIEIQRTLTKRNADIAPDRRIEVKIGIHIGDVVHRGGDVYGDGVNIASRIEPIAGPGGICVSTDVERQIRNAVETRFEKLAPTELKNISVPMELFRIVLPWETKASPSKFETPVPAGKLRPKSQTTSRSWILAAAVGLIIAALLGYKLGWFTARSPMEGSAPATPDSNRATQAGLAGARPSIPEKSIAVLPFENLSEDKSNAFFADGHGGRGGDRIHGRPRGRLPGARAPPGAAAPRLVHGGGHALPQRGPDGVGNDGGKPEDGDVGRAVGAQRAGRQRPVDEHGAGTRSDDLAHCLR
jgi:class 3 adenylate cyclase